MTEYNSYQELLDAQKRVKTQIEVSQDIIEANIKHYIKPRNLFKFFEDKIEKEAHHQFSGEFELKKYLISLSLDFLYNKAIEAIIKSDMGKDSQVEWKLIVKSLVDQVYIKNRVVIADIISAYVDEYLDKLKKD